MSDAIKNRFMDKVFMIPEAGCWIWAGASHPTGYGRFGMYKGDVDFAHRASWRLFRGAIPKGIYVCHHCDVRMCVNPNHLFLGTATDNMRDASKKNRIKMPPQSYASSDAHQVAKLTNENVREIRSSSVGSFALARKFGVSPSTIWSARTGRTFKDVE